MIKFKTIKWKNFLSTGNAETVIQLDKSPTTLIIGKNGHGKSTLLDALCFAIYGKPFRNVTKSQLVNSKNGKNCLVIVEFATEGKEYRVVRGIKPNIFEIYVDGQLLTQEAAIRDYQKILEKQILKMNFKTFTQVVILGSSSFTPFMKLSAGHRREVIEDILDIKIFSTMSQVLKDKVAETKTAIASLDTEIVVLKGQAVSQKNLIDILKKNRKDIEKDLREKITNNHRRIVALRKDKDVIKEVIAHKYLEMPQSDPSNQIERTRQAIQKTKGKIEELRDTFDFFEDHSECPSCLQQIADDHKSMILHNHQNMYDAQEVILEKLEKEMVNFQIELSEYNTEVKNINDEVRQLQIDSSSIDAEIRTIEDQTVDYQEELNELDQDSTDLDAEKAKLKQMAADVTKKMEDKIALTEKRNLQEVANTLLKDSGIKTKIIREYMPLMNNLINKYLQVQDSFILFELDEEFNETIRSRHRDEFSYSSFSEGERQRIDLAILFTWRQIARLKNSANTNLLILDEIMDGSLDSEGTDSAQHLIDSLAADGTHVFVVTHSVDQHADKFDRILKFDKKNDYSIMAEL